VKVLGTGAAELDVSTGRASGSGRAEPPTREEQPAAAPVLASAAPRTVVRYKNWRRVQVMCHPVVVGMPFASRTTFTISFMISVSS
jgi:hypothetical protein